MNDNFKMHIFYLDGQMPESGTQSISSLSPRWLNVCSELLDINGLVFKQNMGDTLSHFDIEMAGPIGKLKSYGEVCYEFAITTENNSNQNEAAISHFETLLYEISKITGNQILDGTIQIVRASSESQTLLVFDHSNSNVDEQQLVALMQLGIHLAASYIKYLRKQ